MEGEIYVALPIATNVIIEDVQNVNRMPPLYGIIVINSIIVFVIIILLGVKGGVCVCRILIPKGIFIIWRRRFVWSVRRGACARKGGATSVRMRRGG